MLERETGDALEFWDIDSKTWRFGRNFDSAVFLVMRMKRQDRKTGNSR